METAKNNLIGFTAILALMILGLAATQWSPLWFGTPEGGATVTALVYLVIALLWLPVAIWLHRKGSITFKHRLVWGLIGIILPVYVILLLTIWGPTPSSAAKWMQQDSSFCQAHADDDARFDCSTAQCEVDPETMSCKDPCVHDLSYARYTLQQVARLPVYRVMSWDYVFDSDIFSCSPGLN